MRSIKTTRGKFSAKKLCILLLWQYCYTYLNWNRPVNFYPFRKLEVITKADEEGWWLVTFVRFCVKDFFPFHCSSFFIEQDTHRTRERVFFTARVLENCKRGLSKSIILCYNVSESTSQIVSILWFGRSMYVFLNVIESDWTFRAQLEANIRIKNNKIARTFTNKVKMILKNNYIKMTWFLFMIEYVKVK